MQHENPHLLMRSKVIYHGQRLSEVTLGWKCENGLIWSWKSDLNQTWFIDVMCEPSCSCSQRLCTKVKGHLRSSCKKGWKYENGLIWKVELWFKPNLVYWYNMETFICSCSQGSQIKVRCHLRSTSEITWNCKFWLIAYFRTNCPNRYGYLDQMLTYITHRPWRQATLEVRGPQSIFYSNRLNMWLL